MRTPQIEMMERFKSLQEEMRQSLEEACKKYQKTSLSLLSMYKKATKILREYMLRFNDVALEVPSTNAKVLANAFAQGLNDGDFYQSLAKKSAIHFDNLLARSEKYMNIEEAIRMKGTKAPIPNNDRRETRRLPKRPCVEEKYEVDN
ncbi:hypothetical protein BUALT_Bualt06G0025800 [Buddleja alternifolia]|uniref:Uncharacterized protein n=1 Tax=Buddleja alternifolia TaxID=168488 RepID=A0AAV6XJ37_9LAMI|nr:hypothetical protein BUALT_Bualt06G0025800 [Buddleja alternifolia]